MIVLINRHYQKHFWASILLNLAQNYQELLTKVGLKLLVGFGQTVLTVYMLWAK